MIRILALDGGGARGIIELAVLSSIESVTEKPVRDIFKLISASSVGTLIGALTSAATVPCSKVLDEMMAVVDRVFRYTPHIPLIQPMYSRKPIDNMLRPYLDGKKMSDCQNMLMFTSVSTADGRTHYFKSWEPKDGSNDLIETVHKSYAAPSYFGAIRDKENKTSWVDGGSGNANCPLSETLVEISRQNWQGERVHVLSIGTGSSARGVPYKETKWWGQLRQTMFFFDLRDGGLARWQSAQTQVAVFNSIGKISPNITFQRLDCEIPKKMDKLDSAKYKFVYKRYGEEISKNIDFGPLTDPKP